jgi:GNAT superfamily N-acetyltransferase
VFRVERLTSDHDIDQFTSGNGDLDSWPRGAALTADRAGTARVRVWLDEANIVGYFAIVPHTMRRAELPPAVGRGAPNVVPGFLLARLALAERLHGRGHGGELLADALLATLDAIHVGGGRVIVVDAIDDNAHEFYQHFGFGPIAANDDRLVIKASTAATSLDLDWP